MVTSPNPSSQPGGGKPARKRRKALAPSQKYEVFTATLTSSATQRELAEKYGVDRTTIRSICATAKQGALDALTAAVPGRRTKSAEQAQLEDARAEIEQIEAGLKSRTQALAERGYDAEQVDREIAAERKRGAELGLDFRRPGSPAQAAGGGTGPGDAEGQQENRQDGSNQDDDGENREPRPAEDA